MNYSVRTAHDHDIGLIQSLAHEIWPKAYGHMISQDQMVYMLEWMYNPDSLSQQMNEGHRFLILEDQSNTACGYASYRQINAGTWKLEKLYVLTDKHRLGMGRVLLQKVMREVKLLGASHLVLQVNRQNPAVGFYKHLGFQVIRDEDIDIGNGFFMNDHIMEMPIP